jgi:DNA-binding NarL/FixJ family response regulator
MNNVNSLLLIANNKEEVLKFRSKLMLLRDVDSIVESNLLNALLTAQKYVPDTIIIFAENKDEQVFEIIREIRTDELLKHIPIIILVDSCDEEYILSGFDAGMSDYISLPARDSEILMRVIWALQKSEISRDLFKKEQLLEDLEVFNKKTGTYKSKYISKVFSNELNSAQRYKYPLSFMVLALAETSKDKVSEDVIAEIIKKSLRGSDILGIPEENKFYVVLPKTKLNGLFTVVNRIKEKMLPDINFHVGVCEIDEKLNFKELAILAHNALKQAERTGERIVIADKLDSFQDKSKEDWLNKMQVTSKNYKLFKQVFNKKLKNVIEPVFYQAQQNLRLKYDDKIVIEQFTTESKCFFSIKNIFENKEVVLKITDIGFSKIALDIFFNTQETQDGQQEKIELSELDSKKLINIIENIASKFDNL